MGAVRGPACWFLIHCSFPETGYLWYVWMRLGVWRGIGRFGSLVVSFWYIKQTGRHSDSRKHQ